jgi:putative ABC transport system permease protein
MSLLSRIANVLRGDRLYPAIDEELESHIDEAIKRGIDAAEARRAFGSALRRREEIRDVLLIGWLDSLRKDAIFAWRQLIKRKMTSGVAVLSLALAIGACTAAFRLIDALFLRPLPVAEPERLYALLRTGTGTDGQPLPNDTYEYELFRHLRETVKDRAELIAVSVAQRMDVTYGSEREMEKATVQYVSGSMFPLFQLRPALGRLFNENDDRKPRVHPYAVLSYDYWTGRFGRDPSVLGRRIEIGRLADDAGDDICEIIGVADKPFTGTEPGKMTDVFLPAMMHPGVTLPGWGWLKTLVYVKAGAAAGPVGERLRAAFQAFEQQDAAQLPAENRTLRLRQTVDLTPAAAGPSTMQTYYQLPLAALSVLVGLVLLITCTNLASLMTAQGAARAREFALRVSIGAGRFRLMQLALVENAILAAVASILGGVFAWWSAPMVVSKINPSFLSARLNLALDWRVLGFGFALTFAVTLLFGLGPAIRASGVKPSSALKGRDDPRSRRRLMYGLIAAQVAFCFLVVFLGGLFVTTFRRLADRPTGFSAERLLSIEILAPRNQPPPAWQQLEGRVRTVPGVEAAALAGFPLLNGSSWSAFVSISGDRAGRARVHFLNVSPGWFATMKIPVMEGRDFRPAERYPGPVVVNETLARSLFDGITPVGKSFDEVLGSGRRIHFEVVGVVGDALYHDLREPPEPVVYVPFHSVDRQGTPQGRGWGTLYARTAAGNPLALAATLQRAIPRQSPEFRVAEIRTQSEIDDSNIIRERLLAMLASFFAVVALLLAGIGLYGVLEYSVFQRRRETGIRMAIGAPAREIVWRTTAEALAMVSAGAPAGLMLGLASARYIRNLLYQVQPADPRMLLLPSLILFAVALVAALPAVIRSVRVDPVTILRAE